MNITGSRDERIFYIDYDKVMIDGKMYYDKTPQNLAQPNAQSVLSEVRALQGYKCFCAGGRACMVTESDGEWIEKDDVIRILSEHFR